MQIKKLISGFALTGVLLSPLAYADITIKNNSDAYVTGQTSSSPCSSIIGEQGIISPYAAPKVVPQVVFDMYCPRSCNVYVYTSRSCSGQKIATVKVEQGRGVVSVTNHSTRYAVSGSGKNVAILGPQ